MNDIVAIMKAAEFAAHKHVGQRRKGGEAEPYLNHLIEVASLVAEATNGDPDAVIAALLHDAVEDQGVTNAEIADLFGPTAASLVAEVARTLAPTRRVSRAVALSGFPIVGAAEVAREDAGELGLAAPMFMLCSETGWPSPRWRALDLVLVGLD